MINCVVVDDEIVSRSAVEQCIKNTPSLNLVASYDSASEFSKHVGEKQIDLIFLDIEMPGMSGVDFVRAYRDIPQVIFVTSNTNYAFEAYQYDVTDYIEKPIDYTRFKHAVEKAEVINHGIEDEKSNPEIIYLKSGNQHIKINLNQLLYIEALGDYIKVFTETERHTLLSTMKSIEAKLKPYNFLRIHKSFIVNMGKVKRVKGSIVELENMNLPIGRVYKPELKQRLTLMQV